MPNEYEFVAVQIERTELTLIQRLLERAQEAGWTKASEQDDFTALLGTVREAVIDFDALRQLQQVAQEQAARAARALDVDPANVPHLPGAQEIAPGVFLAPTPAPITEIDHLALGLDSLDVWTPEDGAEAQADDQKELN